MIIALEYKENLLRVYCMALNMLYLVDMRKVIPRIFSQHKTWNMTLLQVQQCVKTTIDPQQQKQLKAGEDVIIVDIDAV